MTKEKFIEQLNLWVGRLEDGEIFDDYDSDENVNVKNIMDSITTTIIDSEIHDLIDQNDFVELSSFMKEHELKPESLDGQISLEEMEELLEHFYS